MKYQLILQFPGQSLSEYDAIVDLEEHLSKELAGSADVDGHDVGPDTINLFIWTTDPAATFEQATPVLERLEHFDWVTAAYREANEDRYTVIWPEDWKKEFKLN